MEASESTTSAARGRALQDEHVRGFVQSLRSRGRSEETVAEYLDDVVLFMAHQSDIARATSDDIERFQQVLMIEKRLANSTVRRKLSVLRTFYKYLAKARVRSDNPAQLVDLPALPKRLPKPLDQKVVARILSGSIAGKTDEQQRRDRAIMELLYSSGIRRSELVRLDLDDVDIDKLRLTVIGKGNKQRVTFMNASTAAALSAYLSVRPQVQSSALFLSRRRDRLSTRQLWAIVRDIVSIVGKVKPAGPHVFRHSFATHLVESGVPIDVVRALLGHESTATTDIYTKVSQAHLRAEYDKAHLGEAETS